MSREDLCDIINKRYRTKDGARINGKLLRAPSQSGVYDLILNATSCLDENYDITARVYWLLKDHTTIPTCMTCNKPTRYNKQHQDFNRYCSARCAQNDLSVREKIEATNVERYGVRHAAVADVVREKQRATNKLKYGTETPFQNKEIQQKVRHNILEKYGVISTALLPEVRSQQEQTNQERYGVNKPFESEIIQQKAVVSVLTKNNGKMTAQRHISHEALSLLSNKAFLEREYLEKELSAPYIAESLGVSSTLIYQRLASFGIPIRESSYQSQDQIKLTEFIRKACGEDVEVVCNTKNIIYPYELDIYIPSLNLAVEYNGLYWHSETQGKHSRYHLNKTEMCINKGITLLHVFETEWKTAPELVKSMISVRCGSSLITKIHARKCRVLKLSVNETEQFVNQNHIQGHTPCTSSYGLLYNDELVAVMTFGTPRFSKKHKWELLRFCTKQNTVVVGGANKLFKLFLQEHDPESVISYCDRRWGEGNVYPNLGMALQGTSRPSYHYFSTNGEKHLKLYNRVFFQKHKLQQRLVAFDPSLTEWENMRANGYDRIWDCGNNVYIWRRNEIK